MVNKLRNGVISVSSFFSFFGDEKKMEITVMMTLLIEARVRPSIILIKIYYRFYLLV